MIEVRPERCYSVAKLRVSIVEYLNTSPLVWGFTRGPLRGRYHLSFTVPSQCAESLRTGFSDVAIIPAIEYQRIDNVVALPEMAIAAKREARSLLVLSKRPIAEARRIALDSSSRSTQALVRILCAEHWNISPEFTERSPGPAMLSGVDAALVIGDPALRLAIELDPSRMERRPTLSGPLAGQRVACHGVTPSKESGKPPEPWGPGRFFVYDVVTEWRKLTGVPCVLALWAGRSEAMGSEVVSDFLASKEYGISRIGEIAVEASGRLGLPAAALETYLRDNIDFSLDDENLRGLDLYFRKCASLNLTGRPKPLEFAPIAANVPGGS
jgi:chorismate dehydratase